MVCTPRRGYHYADPSPGIVKLREMEAPAREAQRAEQERVWAIQRAERQRRHAEIDAMVEGARGTQDAKVDANEQSVIDTVRKRDFTQTRSDVEEGLESNDPTEWNLKSLRQCTEQDMRESLDKMD